MNYRIILKSLGILLICEAVAILIALSVSAFYGEPETISFLYTFLIIIVIGAPLSTIKSRNENFFPKDGFAVVGIGWLAISVLGSLPFYISGSIPSLPDSLFESISGFTTTGASILTDIESMPKGILFWRSFTHWMGGMGVLMLALAILPSAGAKTLHMMKAEAPGPSPGKLVPRIGQTAKILYGIYIIITASQIVALKIAGLSLFDAVIHSFGTAGTGGFSNRNLSVGAYNNVSVEIIIAVFMLLFGINFTLYYQAFKGNIKSFAKNEEFRFYIGVIFVSILFITVNLYGTVFDKIHEALRYSFFQVSSIITTTGYATHDFNEWPVFSKMILILLMFIGASSGSTGGAMKSIRILLLVKILRREVVKIKHPNAVHPVKLSGSIVGEEIITSILVFFFAYIFIFVAAVMVVSLEGKDLVTTVTSVIASIGNIGPGFEKVGAMGNYSEFSVLSKGVLSVCMIVGRLEIYPVLLLIFPSFWKRVNI